MNRELSKALELYSTSEEKKARVADLFKYSTRDEAEPGKERDETCVTIEVGGPCTHVKFSILTRKEHTIMKDAIKQIIDNRLEMSGNEIDKLCLERVHKNDLSSANE